MRLFHKKSISLKTKSEDHKTYSKQKHKVGPIISVKPPIYEQCSYLILFPIDLIIKPTVFLVCKRYPKLLCR